MSPDSGEFVKNLAIKPTKSGHSKSTCAATVHRLVAHLEGRVVVVVKEGVVQGGRRHGVAVALLGLI